MIPKSSAIQPAALILNSSTDAWRAHALRIIRRQAQDEGCVRQAASFTEAPGA